MAQLEDTEVRLNPVQPYSTDERIIEVDVSSRFNVLQYAMQPYIGFDQGAFNYARVDEATGTRIVLSLKDDVVLGNADEGVAVSYTVTSANGDALSGRILFPEIEFEINVSDIGISLDSCCSIPDVIKIDVRDYNGGRPVGLTGVGSNDSDAGTVTLTDVASSDYNDDYNDDFGSDLHKTITYTLNKTTTFWKTVGAVDRFSYNVSYKGKTASGIISIKLLNSNN